MSPEILHEIYILGAYKFVVPFVVILFLVGLLTRFIKDL